MKDVNKLKEEYERWLLAQGRDSFEEWVKMDVARRAAERPWYNTALLTIGYALFLMATVAWCLIGLMLIGASEHNKGPWWLWVIVWIPILLGLGYNMAKNHGK